MEQNLEDKFKDKFKLDDHPLFRTLEDSNKLVYNMQPLPPLNLKPTNEERLVPGQQSQFGGTSFPVG